MSPRRAVKHFRGPLVDSGIKSFALRIESETQNAKAAQRFASLPPKFGHSPMRGLARGPARGLARGQAHLDRADHLGNVIGVNAVRCRSVEPVKDAMQVLGAVLLGAAAEFVAQLFEALRTWKKSFKQSAQIESGSSANDGQAAALPAFAQNVFAQNVISQYYLVQNLPRLAGIFSRAYVGERIHAIEQVMRNLGSLCRAGLGRSDFKFAVHGN